MLKNQPAAVFDRSDPKVLDRLAKVQRVCLAIVVLIGATTLCAWIITSTGFNVPFPFTLMKANTALAALASAISLWLSQPHRSRRSLHLSRFLAILVLMVAAASLVEHSFGITLGLDTLISGDPSSKHPGLMSPQSGSSFALLGVVMLLIRTRKAPARYIADFFVASLSVLVLVIVSGYVFGANPLFRVAATNWTSPQTQLSLLLLTFTAFGRRTEYGSFKLLVGTGIGSRIARACGPILLVLPFVREAGRMRLIHTGTLPGHYVTAILASAAAVASFTLMMIVAWRINGMEQKIHNLSLRDELTGLYNLRGFHLLAEQSLRLAQRANLPFSVLFVDLDNLKQINDGLGHGVGSQFLVETGELLLATFRETDVVGRIGGDEFAVAGQFTLTAIVAAARRLEDKSALATPEIGRSLPLSLSIGYVTTEDRGHETLADLLAKADKAMYQHKKEKKLLARRVESEAHQARA